MKRVKKIEGDQLAIDELLPDTQTTPRKPPKRALKKEPLYRVARLK